jgi:GrpB-like predicted nucleotidyltransferase (UPF0157 family)
VDAPIVIERYNPAWVDAFETERALLAEVLQPWLAGPIEHFGSTAVPGLAAKPVIDIMAAVVDLDTSRPALEALRAHSYCYAPYREEVVHWFCKPGPEMRTHHLHLVPFRSPHWLKHIAFRDLLRENANIAREYEDLKWRLAGLHRNDRDAYTDAKGAFIARALEQNQSRRI